MRVRSFFVKIFVDLAFFLVLLSSDHIFANRSSIVFFDDAHAIYKRHSMLFKYDLRLRESSLIEGQKQVGYDKKFFGDVAISYDDGSLWSVVKDNGADYLMRFAGSQFTYTTAIKHYRRFYDTCDDLFLSQDCNALVAIRKQESEISLISMNLSRGKAFELKHVRDDILLSDLRTVDMTNDGRIVVLNFYKNGHLCVWQPEKNLIDVVHSGLGGEYFSDFVLAPDGSNVLSISGHGAELWNVHKQRFDYVFRWESEARELKAYSCPPKVDGWVIDSKIYYRTAPAFFFSPHSEICCVDNSKTIFMWGKVRKAVFSSDSKFIFILTNLDGYFEGLAPWRLDVFDIYKKTFVRSIEIFNLNECPEMMAVTPCGTSLLLMSRDGEIKHISLL